MHGLGNFKIRWLRLAPILLQIYSHMLIKPVYINAAHFKTEGQWLIITGLFITMLRWNTSRTGKIGITCTVDKGLGTNSSQPGNGLNDAGLNDGIFLQCINQYSLIQNIHTGFCTHFIINECQRLRVMPGLLSHAIKGFNAMFPQAFLDLCYIGRVTIRRMGIHKGINTAQYCQAAQCHTTFDEHRFSAIPCCHNRSRRPGRAATGYTHIG